MKQKPEVCMSDLRKISKASESVGNVPSHRLIVYYSPTTGRSRYNECIGGQIDSEIGEGIIPGDMVVVVEHYTTPQQLADRIVETYSLWHSGKPKDKLRQIDPANSLYLPELDGLNIVYDEEKECWYGCSPDDSACQDDSYADIDDDIEDPDEDEESESLDDILYGRRMR